MRIITGTARGFRLKTLEGLDTRPTTERVKEALFSILQFEMEGRRVLDLFAGSGQLGIEALSRGAAGCVFVDRSAEAVEVIKQNLHGSGLATRSQVLCQDALSFLVRPHDTFDIVLLDPPYQSGLLLPALEAVVPYVSPGGVITCETAADAAMPERVGAFSLFRSYRYGKILLWVYRAAPQTPETEEVSQ